MINDLPSEVEPKSNFVPLMITASMAFIINKNVLNHTLFSIDTPFEDISIAWWKTIVTPFTNVKELQ